MPCAAWRPQGSEGWPWAKKRTQGSKSDSGKMLQACVSVCVRVCVCVCVCVCVEGGSEALFQVLSPPPHLQPHPHPHPPAYLPSPPYTIIRPRPLPRLSELPGSDPLFQKPGASQLAPQPPIASWHPEGRLSACTASPRGPHSPSTSPDTWSTGATKFGNSRTPQTRLAWWLQAHPGARRHSRYPWLWEVPWEVTADGLA